MLRCGAYPAAITPFASTGEVDMPSVARLLAHFEHSGCAGAVLAGTNGEGPSLSAIEKRDLLREAMPLRGNLELILGIATPSLHEATWLTDQAGKAGAAAILLMAPGYFRKASDEGIEAWLRAVMDAASIPVVIYQFPRMAGVEISDKALSNLASHPQFGGIKDSSGQAEHLARYAEIADERGALLVGDETLLPQALDAGWTGTISGCANSVPGWLAKIVAEHGTESGQAKWEMLRPVIKGLRAMPQPMCHKGVLHTQGVISQADVRLPLASHDPADAIALIERNLGPITARSPQ